MLVSAVLGKDSRKKKKYQVGIKNPSQSSFNLSMEAMEMEQHQQNMNNYSSNSKEKTIILEHGKYDMTENSTKEDEQKEKRRSRWWWWWEESKKMWEIAGPAMIVAVSQFSIDFVTAAFVGHLGSLQLAAVSVVQNVIESFVYGVMLGLGSALETLCGQAVGAGQTNMLGIYLQRSWIVSAFTALLLTPVYIFTSPILKLLHQDKAISDLAGKYALWVIPQSFAYGLNFPIQKFLQSQTKVWFMTIMSTIVLGIHVLLNWILVIKYPHGLLGAAIAGNISWFLLILSHVIYILSGFCPNAWTGFSSMAFKSLKGFIKLSIASAIMTCLELWYFTIIILMVGLFKNPEIAVDAMSICMNLDLWVLMAALGFNAAVSVRVSNELGAGRPKAAKLSVKVATSTSAGLAIIIATMILAFKEQFPKLFTDKTLVVSETSKLGYFLATTIFLNSIQLVLHGVAVGAGWQVFVALVSVGCCYIVGLPAGALLGYKLRLGVRGIWAGMLVGFVLETVILLYLVLKTNWHIEVLQSEQRMKTWSGSTPEDMKN